MTFRKDAAQKTNESKNRRSAKGRLLRFGKLLLLSAVSLIVLVIVLLNVLKFAIYADYYAIRTNVCVNPGLGDGFVCQDVCAYEDGGSFFVSGYMADGAASRIYVTGPDTDSYYVSLTLDGRDFTGHSGGIATDGSNVFLLCNSAIHTLPLQRLLEAENGDSIAIEDRIPIDNRGSSAYCDDTYLYVGEFCNDKNHIARHPFDTPDGEYHAIIGRYRLDDLSAPDKVYSIQEKVQGICFTPDGQVILSTSYGLADSYYYVYDESSATDSGLLHEGAPVFLLCDAEYVLKGPAMAEGLDYYNGKVITLSECASNKYIFGKFFFADKIVALDLVETR